jgi:O-antigen/teichoic acid export membrane protein
MFKYLRLRSRALQSRQVQASDDGHVRGIERDRRAATTSLLLVLSRVVQMGTSLITVRLTLRYLGTERFGLWMTISSVLAMASFADFGVGIGVMNTIAKALGNDDVDEIRKVIASGFAAMNSIGAFLLLVFFAFYRFVNWADFFHVETLQARSEAGPALAVFASCFVLNIGMDVVQRVQLGLQEGYYYSVWQLLGSIAGFIGVLTGIWLHANLPALILALAGAPLLATIVNALHYFGWLRPDMRPKRRYVSRSVMWDIARIGGQFFILTMIVTVSFSADNLIIARTLGASSVPVFSVPQKMFAQIGVLTAMLLTPLWPAYGEAVSRGDILWVQRKLSRTLVGMFALTSLMAFVLVVFSPRILLLWVGPTICPSFMLILGLGVWAVSQSVAATLQMFMNGASIMRFQIVTHCFFGAVCLTAKVWSARHYGVAAMPWATAIPYGLLIIIPSALYIPQLLRRMKTEVQADVPL